MTLDQITIGFPTFMRREAIVARIDKLLADPRAAELRLLVSDNASTDGSYEALCERVAASSPQLSVVRNPSNLGMTGNFCRLVHECATEYLVIMSDEDDLLTDELPALVELLADTRALFVSPQMLIDGQRYRGEDSTREIPAEAFFSSSFYLSGLVYHAPSARRCLERLDRLQHSNSLCHLYPTVITALELMLAGPAYWLARPLCEKVQRLPSHIRDLGGVRYPSVQSRWRQHLDLIAYLEERRQDETGDGALRQLDAMVARTENSLYDKLLRAIARERPASADAFRRAAAAREVESSEIVTQLRAKLENFRGMIARRDEKIAKLEARLAQR